MSFDVELAGCRTEPLGSYLKSLAVLRLVAEQKDAHAKGYWKDGTFHLVSELDEDALTEFFAVEYAPTPIVGPWGARSGFFSGSSEKAARDALTTIEQSAADRFARFREAIHAARACLAARGVSEKAKDAEKVELLAALRNSLPEQSLRWLDAAYVLGGSIGERGFPIVLGTGGNEGSQGFSSTFMQALLDLGLTSERVDRSSLVGALFGKPTHGVAGAATGQFAPGDTPGFNQGPGFSGGLGASACDMVLALEGAATWVSGATKRSHAGALSRLTSPFTVRSRAVGFNSADADESKARGEIWAPLWSRPASWQEVDALLSEGRAQWNGRDSRTALDMAKAAGSLGVDRGIDGFERFALLDRNGKNYFAVSLGRFQVFERSHTDLLRQLDGPLGHLDRRLHQLGDYAPQRLVAVRRRLDDALFACLQQSTSSTMSVLLRTIGRLEGLQASMDGGRNVLTSALGGLSAHWISACGDSIDLRIAVAIASIRGEGDVGLFRANLIPVDPRHPSKFVSGAGQVAWEGHSLPARMAAVLRRRLLDYERLACPALPLSSVISLQPEDAISFLDGRTDDTLLEDLIFGLSWIDWRSSRGLEDLRARWRRPVEGAGIAPAYALLSSVLDPGQRYHEPRVVPRLVGGRLEAAIELATTRLRVAGARPVRFSPTTRRMPAVKDPGIDPLRLAAALLIPILSGGRKCLLQIATHPNTEQRSEA